MQKPAENENVLTVDAVEAPSHQLPGWLSRIASRITSWGVELRGITPVPLEERTDSRYINVFFVWFTMSTTLSP